jgi:hypothetical protein
MFEFKGSGDDMLSEGCEVVLVSSANFADQTVETKSFQEARHLRGGFRG